MSLPPPYASQPVVPPPYRAQAASPAPASEHYTISYTDDTYELSCITVLRSIVECFQSLLR